ncbi:MAG TPA: phosphoadenylyl-sulfate reductase [Gemmatimonadaceae bacterium]|nr:phosphoadenylyl-sulfate reductase [Gemmatimonadaceae bacterium]
MTTDARATASTILTPAGLQSAAGELRAQSPEEILAWTLRSFPGRTAVTVSFGGPGVALAYMASRIEPATPIVFLDTGFLFPETYALRDEFVRRYDLNLREYTPLTDPGPLYETDTDGCCAIRKVEPMQRALGDFDAWVSGVRRDQGPSRANTEVVEHHLVSGRPLAKVYPLAYWTRGQIWSYLLDHGIPYNPLLDQGYASLGCWPCTRATRAGEDERAGRWSGTGKTECGLHTFTSTGTSTPDGGTT